MAWLRKHSSGSMFTALLAAVPLVIGSGLLVLSFTSPRKGKRTSGPFRSLADLRRSIVGTPRRKVIQLLGPPRTATLKGQSPASTIKSPEYLKADTWYYPLEEQDNSAMAIQFAGDRVKEVEFFRSGIS